MEYYLSSAPSCLVSCWMSFCMMASIAFSLMVFSVS